MTLKQKLFAEKYLEFGNGTRAVLDTYNVKDANVASSIAYKNLRKPEIQAEINRYLRRRDVSLEAIIDSLKNIIDHGTPGQQLEANLIVLKMYGLR